MPFFNYYRLRAEKYPIGKFSDKEKNEKILRIMRIFNAVGLSAVQERSDIGKHYITLTHCLRIICQRPDCYKPLINSVTKLNAPKVL